MQFHFQVRGATGNTVFVECLATTRGKVSVMCGRGTAFLMKSAVMTAMHFEKV